MMYASRILLAATTLAWFIAAYATAGENVIAIKLPLSDLTRSDLPFVISVNLPDDMLNASGVLTLKRHEDEGDAVAPIEQTFELIRKEEGPTEIVIDPSILAEGEYVGEIVVIAGEQEARQSFSLFRMVEGKPSRGIRYGTYAVPFRNPDTIQDTVDMLHRHGVDLIQTHINDIWRVNKPYDRAARLGVEFMPSITTLGWRLQRSDEHHIFFADGDKPNWPWVCFKNATNRERAAGHFAEFVQEFKKHAGFSGYIYYGDDLVIPMKREDGKVILGCYCAHCSGGFEELTGNPPPAETEALSGVIPADNLYLQWMRYRVEDVYGGFVKDMHIAKNSVDPEIQLGLIHGWSGQPFINLARASYSPITHRHTDAVSSYTYPNHRYPRMNFIPHFEMGRMNNREKEVWMLGILGMNNTLMHDFVIYQNYWLMLASGYKMIAYFGWNEYVRALEAEENTIPHFEETIDAHIRVGQHKNWLFPAAAHWNQTPARHAVLFSFTTEAVDVMPENRGFEHLTDVMEFHREALRQRVPMHFVSEEEIRDGILANYDALCLHAVKALPEDVHKIITEYAAGEGKVYVSDSKVKIEGGLESSMETAVALCRDDVTPVVNIPDRDVIVRDFYSGDLRYYVLVNNYADRYHGLPFSYGSPDVNYEQGRMIQERNLSISNVATFREKGLWLFDMSTGQPLGNSNAPYAFSIEPSWGQAVVGLAVEAAKLEVAGPAAATQGNSAIWQVRFVDPQGNTINGAFTVKVDITNPAGRASRYSGYFSVAGGVLEVPLHLGANDQTGAWIISIEGGFPRGIVTRTLEVKQGEAVPAILTTR